MATRVLLAKPGLDGHDRGIKVIAHACRDAGFEVVYTGMRQTPASIAEAALQEDVNVVGLSVLSGSHLSMTRQVCQEMAARNCGDTPVIVGGTIPERDEQALRDSGASAVFGISSSLQSIVDYIRALPERRP
jgi:methylmalonyl-CoA mutase, C-terminal domain